MSGTRYCKAASIGITKFEKSKKSCMCPLCDKTPIENINGYTIPLQKVLYDVNKYKNEESTVKMRYKDRPITSTERPKNELPYKSFISGYKGHVPNIYSKYGLSYVPASNDALDEFSTRYKRLKSNLNKLVVANVRSKPILQRKELPYDTGMIKNYAGHIPGHMYNVGKSFSEGSKDTRRILGQRNI